MLRFFRKMRNTLIPESRFGRYFFYALGEILLVVIGILIALQVNNWNTHRKNHQLERVILQDMSDNLMADVNDLHYNIKKDSLIVSGIGFLTEYIISKKPYNDSLAEYFGSAAGFTNFINNTTALESLRSLGFGYISNKSLRTAILKYYDHTVNNTVRVESDILDHFQQNLVEPFMVKHFYYSSMNKPAIPVNYPSLCTSHTYQSLLATKKEYLKWDIRNFRECIREAMALNNSIQKELLIN